MERHSASQPWVLALLGDPKQIPSSLWARTRELGDPCVHVEAVHTHEGHRSLWKREGLVQGRTRRVLVRSHGEGVRGGPRRAHPPQF